MPYHLLARNAAHRWWRPLAALAVLLFLEVVALFLGAILLMATAAFPGGFEILGIAAYSVAPQRFWHLFDQSSPMTMLYLGFGLIIAMLPPVFLTARWVQKRPPGTLSAVSGGLRWSWLAECVVLALLPFLAAFAVMAGYDVVTATSEGPGFPGWPDYLRILLISVLIVPFQCATEEYVFRGFLFQTLCAWLRTPWAAMVPCTALFIAGHGYTDPSVIAQLALMAVIMSWLTVRTGGLEAAIGLHIANNSLGLIVAGLSGIPNLDQGGEYPLIQVWPVAVASIIYAWLADHRCARHGVANTTAGRVSISPWSLQPVTRPVSLD